MTFKLDSAGVILDWDRLSLEDRDKVINALEYARLSYMYETRRIFNSVESAKNESSDIRELMPYIGKPCRVQGIKGVFKGIEETYEDYYYILEQEDGNIFHESMVANIKFNNN
jgi:hypothetical protein